jgi:hypothetical protein
MQGMSFNAVLKAGNVSARPNFHHSRCAGHAYQENHFYLGECQGSTLCDPPDALYETRSFIKIGPVTDIIEFIDNDQEPLSGKEPLNEILQQLFPGFMAMQTIKPDLEKKLFEYGKIVYGLVHHPIEKGIYRFDFFAFLSQINAARFPVSFL